MLTMLEKTLLYFLLVLIVLESTYAKVLRNSDSEENSKDRSTDKKALLAGNIVEENVEEAQKRHLKWPLGVVPYYLDRTVYDELVSQRVRVAMNAIEESSCVQFKALDEDWYKGNWIYITNPYGVRACVHETESNGTAGQTVMVLGLECLQQRDILHTLLHALGFKDEVTHPQRDQYVRIKWTNIRPKFRTLFHIDHQGFPTAATEYDPMSIMHFHDRAFTKNGKATIAPLVPGLVINPSRTLSPLDKMKLRLMFGHECNRRKVEDLVDVCKATLNEDGDSEADTRATNKNNGLGDDGGNNQDVYSLGYAANKNDGNDNSNQQTGDDGNSNNNDNLEQPEDATNEKNGNLETASVADNNENEQDGPDPVENNNDNKDEPNNTIPGGSEPVDEGPVENDENNEDSGVNLDAGSEENVANLRASGKKNIKKIKIKLSGKKGTKNANKKSQ